MNTPDQPTRDDREEKAKQRKIHNDGVLARADLGPGRKKKGTGGGNTGGSNGAPSWMTTSSPKSLALAAILKRTPIGRPGNVIANHHWVR